MIYEYNAGTEIFFLQILAFEYSSDKYSANLAS